MAGYACQRGEDREYVDGEERLDKLLVLQSSLSTHIKHTFSIQRPPPYL